jgi:hypothetical protein
MNRQARFLLLTSCFALATWAAGCETDNAAQSGAGGASAGASGNSALGGAAGSAGSTQVVASAGSSGTPNAGSSGAPNSAAGSAGEGGAVSAGGGGAGGASGASAGGVAGGALGEEDPCGPVEGRPVVNITADIESDTTWDCSNVYHLTAPVFVRGTLDVPVTLNVEAGTVITGAPGNTLTEPKQNPGALIVTPTARILAQGSRERPIRFTSPKAPGQRAPADWGGLVLLGRSTVNTPGGTATVEGLTDELAKKGVYGKVAGAFDDTWSCGTLEFVRIEFAGFKLSGGKELNALTLGACGSGTVVSHVQAHRGFDDGVEVFGGSVNLRHVVVSGAQDDGLDWDLGWNGRAQYLVIQQFEGRADKGIEGNGYETIDKVGEQRWSSPTLYNATLIGKPDKTGIYLRVGSGLASHNAAVLGFGVNVHVADALTADRLASNELLIQHTALYDAWRSGNAVKDSNGKEWLERVWFAPPSEGALGNTVLSGEEAVLSKLLVSASETAPDYRPALGAPLSSGGTEPPDPWFEATAYRGAFAPNGAAWTSGWTEFPVD